MKTLDEVRDRCIIVPADDSDDGCEHWLYQGAVEKRGSRRIHAPDFTKDPSGRTSLTQSARRAVRHIATGKPIPKGWRVWSRCQVRDCVNPACIGVGNETAYGRARSKSGVDQGRIKRILANRRNSDLQRKVTPAVARAILRSGESNVILAERHGVGSSTVQRVRRGEVRVTGNPFQGLVP